MFDDRHLLTKKVIDGSKTQTRRICKTQRISFSTRINANINGFFDCEQPSSIVSYLYPADDIQSALKKAEDIGGVDMSEIVSVGLSKYAGFIPYAPAE